MRKQGTKNVFTIEKTCQYIMFKQN